MSAGGYSGGAAGIGDPGHTAGDAGRPLAAGAPLPNCPVVIDLQRMEMALAGLRQALSRLSRDVRRCERCAVADACPVLNEYYALVKAGRERALAGFDQVLDGDAR